MSWKRTALAILTGFAFFLGFMALMSAAIGALL